MSPLIIIVVVSSIVGVLATISLLLFLFSSIGKNVHPLQVTESVPRVNTDQFLENLASIAGASRHHVNPDEIEIIAKNEEFRARLLATIEASTVSIAITTYVWKPDEATYEVFSALRRAVARGVSVYLLIDGMGSSLGRRDIVALEEAGVRVSIFRALRLGKIIASFARTHRRVYLFDGELVFMGGAALAQTWLRENPPTRYRYFDVMYVLRGAIVRTIAGSFVTLWSANSTIVPQLFSPVPAPPPTLDRPNALYLAHAPQFDVHPLTYCYWYTIMAARKEMYLISPYFVPGHVLAELLIKKARAGVRVTILTQGTSELWYVQATARSYYLDFLSAGVRIFEYQKSHLHTKLSLYDGVLSIVGSANLDIRSQRLNYENVLVVQSKQFAARNEALLSEYLCDAVELRAEDWARRPFWLGLYERAMRQFSEQF
jgi:cardiolipin synthase A/B